MMINQLLQKTHTVIERLRHREDSEHEQMLVKWALAFIWLGYIGWMDRAHTVLPQVFMATYAFITITFMLFIWIIMDPRQHPLRRVCGIFTDTFFTSYVLLYSGQIGSPLFGAYLFMTFGHGFRYGNTYLYTSAALSIIGFMIVMTFSDYWQQQRALGTGIILAIIVLSLYVSSLISKLHKAVAEAKAANEAKSNFLANMSHEIRTPLNGVIGMSALLSRTRLQEDQKDFVSTIHASAQVLLTLINDILDISKIEAGKVIIKSVDFDLYSLVNTTANLFGSEADRKGLSLNTYITPDIPFLAHGDAQHLRQILINLIGNAIKFTDTGKIDINLTLKNAAAHSCRVRFEVSDTGIGINESDIGKIFEKFSQADESSTRRFGGSGLGMAIAKQLVEAMGGNIGCVSRRNQGSTFWVELQLGHQSILMEEHIVLEQLSRCRVVLANRDAQPCRTIQHHLRSWNTAFDSVDDALDIIRNYTNIEDGRHELTLIITFGTGSGHNPVQFIHEVRDNLNTKSCRFLHVHEGSLSAAFRQELLESGYGSVLEHTPDRIIFMRTLHALITGGRTEPVSTFYSGIQDTPSDYPVSTRSLRILVGEDNPTNQKVIRNILEFANHQVTVVNNGEQVLETLENTEFDLVILDMHMPVMNGLEAARLFRFTHPEKKQIPIMMLTANATREALQACENAGLDAYMTKPVDPDRLLNTIYRLMNHAGTELPETHKPPLKLVSLNNPQHVPLLDVHRLDEMSGMARDSKFIPELVNGYLDTAARHIDSLELSWKQQDSHALSNLVHALDGSSRSIGAVRLANISGLLHKKSKTGMHNLTAADITELRTAYQQTRDALMTYLDYQQSSAV